MKHLYFACILAAVCSVCLYSCKEQSSSISLAGKWDFALDPDNKGVTEKWYERELEDEITLPGSLQSQGYGYRPNLGTEWTGQIVDSSFYFAPEYMAYRDSNNIKVPFWLNPDRHYVGIAWYGKTIVVPENWKGSRVMLEIERAHWSTELYIDGKRIGESHSLSTPHRYVIDSLAPGKHIVAMKVDNRMYVDVGINAHSVSDHTQSNWNGMIGTLTISVKPEVYIDHLRTDPDIEARSVFVKAFMEGKVPESGATLIIRAETQDGKRIGKKVCIDLEPGSENPVCTTRIDLGKDARLWSEFDPCFYRLCAEVKSGKWTDSKETNFGLREFRTSGTRFEVNGTPVFLRGTLECCVFPYTGYPSMEPEYWNKIFSTCRAYGLNHVRFHSWCPPEVAFVEADKLGMYLQVECGTWTKVGSGLPQDKWIKEESERILKEYGNHPSFCLMAHGNEPSGKGQVKYLTELVSYWKSIDDRRVYTSSAGWPFVSTADYVNIPAPRIQSWGAGVNSVINKDAPRTDYDFRAKIRKDRPTVSHEIGQWCVYPDFTEIRKYTGVLKAKNLEIFRDMLSEKGIGNLSDEFLYASGRLQALCYKADIEAALRTPGFAGFQLLGLTDFPGQGTALVGVLNPFWESKGYVDSKEYSSFCNSVVPLARFPKMVWKNTETLDIPLEIANFSGHIMKDAEIGWKISDETGNLLARGSCKVNLPVGNCIPAGNVECALAGIEVPSMLAVSAEIEGTSFRNSWNIWVYPDKENKPVNLPYITDRLDSKAKKILEAGGSVLFMSYGKVPEKNGGDVKVGFSSIFWNTAWTRKQAPHTLGIYCDKEHPALSAFPNDGVSDYQWWDIVSRCDAMVLDTYPEEFAPIVYLVDDWFTNRKLGLLFEARVGNGKLMVCSADISNDLSDRLAAAQFRQSLLEYMASDDFMPAVKLDFEFLSDCFE